MSKIIAVCGSPVSGKTTAGLKIAQELYYATNTPVIFIAPDVNTPALSYLFPRSKDKDLYSLGVALDKTSIIKEDILRQIVNPDSMNNFGLLGFKTGENRYTYPTPTEDKVRELFRACAEIAPVIFIDCSSCFDNLISEMAMRESDCVIQLIVPDLRSMGYYSAYEERYNAVGDKCVKIINLMDNDIFLPIEEVKTHFKNVKLILPYSRPLKQQAITGSLTERLNDSKYKSACISIARQVLSK